MNFMEAVKAMKEGKKVKRKKNYGWHTMVNSTGAFIQIKEGEDGNSEVNERSFNLYTIEATDWEIIEEKKTLSEDITKSNLCPIMTPVIRVNKVKEKLKEFIDLIEKQSQLQFTKRAKEIFGDKLLED